MIFKQQKYSLLVLYIRNAMVFMHVPDNAKTVGLTLFLRQNKIQSVC